MTTAPPPPPPRCASCGEQQTGGVRVKDSSSWFYHTVSAATPTEKRRANLFDQEPGEQNNAQDESDSYVWSVKSSEPMPTRAIAGNLRDNILSRLSTLRALWSEGYITEDEYERSVAVSFNEKELL
uniref:Uncharacterized protein n=1 Tax=Hyaloperonospora arabidopsidis (strain Emoy2) TaxID=559515 RepID=M4BKR3_HYAAE